jgi:hypothetical protein
MRDVEYDVPSLIARGYRRVSRRFGMVARVDREDWREYMAEKLHKTPAQINAAANIWADHYRRVYSKDVLTLPQAKALKVPASAGDSIGWIP